MKLLDDGTTRWCGGWKIEVADDVATFDVGWQQFTRYWGLGSLALETPVNCHSELMEDSLRNIEPVQLGVEQMCQASVELPSITDDTGCGIQQTL